MNITLGNVHSTVTDATDTEHLWIGEYLSWADDTAHFRRRHGYRGDGLIRLYNRAEDTFPAGFTRMVAKGAKDAGFEVTVTDGRDPGPTPEAVDLAWLRDYQVSAVAAAMRRTRGVLWAATGAGKTEIAAGLIATVPTNWAFLVHRTQLGLQARERYRLRTGEDAGVILEGSFQPAMGPRGLTVATFQTLYAKLKVRDPAALAWLATVGGVIVDECHVLPAASFRSVLDAMPNAYWRIGVSGTPMARGDRKAMHLIGCLGSVFYRISAQELIDRGLLAKPQIRMVAHHATSDKKTWQGAYNEIVATGKGRNGLVCRLADKADKPCVVFTKALKQGKQIAKALTKGGHKVEYVDGNAPVPVRMAAVKRLERGDTDILVSTVVMNEGIDIPELRSVVMAAGGSSTIAALQRVGRGMRVVPGKTTFDVWDIDDRGNTWTERHTKERRKAYEVEDYEVQVIETIT